MPRLVRVACLQLQAFDRARAAAGLEHMLAMIDRAAENRPDVMVLPEVSYPAYFMGAPASADEPQVEQVIELLEERAARYGTTLVVGLATPEGGCTFNAAVVVGSDGRVRGSQAKRFLWHFDRRWFQPATGSRLFETSFGRIGVIVCADGRMPEISRELALQGAELIVDTTAWVTTGADRTRLSNPQVDYMLPVRARENGVWFAAANKVGLEAGSILYCGRSGFFAPDGRPALLAGSAAPEIVTLEIDLDEPRAPAVEPRPALYRAACHPLDEQPITRLLDEPLVPARARLRVAVAQQPRDAAPEQVAALLPLLALQDAELVVLSPLGSSSEQVLPVLAPAAADAGLALVVPLIAENGMPRLFLLQGGEVRLAYDQTHGVGAAGEALSPVVPVGGARVGLMVGADAWAPEVPRSLMLEGADLIVWAAADPRDANVQLARTRADENKVYLALALPADLDAELTSSIFGPTGAPLAAALRGEAHAISASVDVAATRLKEMAPGTDVVRDRQPASFAAVLYG